MVMMVVLPVAGYAVAVAKPTGVGGICWYGGGGPTGGERVKVPYKGCKRLTEEIFHNHTVKK